MGVFGLKCYRFAIAIDHQEAYSLKLDVAFAYEESLFAAEVVLLVYSYLHV
jgi:hypothetical protein